MLDKALVAAVKRNPRAGGGLDDSEAMAIAVLKREGVKPEVLAAVFGVSRTTIYHTVLTGNGRPYPSGRAVSIKYRLDQMGLEAARKAYVTPEMDAAVNETHKSMKAAIDQRDRT